MKIIEFIKGKPGVPWTQRDFRPLIAATFVVVVILGTGVHYIGGWVEILQERSAVSEKLEKLKDRLQASRQGAALNQDQLLQLAHDLEAGLDRAKTFVQERNPDRSISQEIIQETLGSGSASLYLSLSQVAGQSTPLADRIDAIEQRMQQNHSESTDHYADTLEYTYHTIICGRAFGKRNSSIYLECVNPSSSQKFAGAVNEEIYARMSKPIYGDYPIRKIGDDTYGVTKSNGLQTFQTAEVLETYELTDPRFLIDARAAMSRLQQEYANLDAEHRQKVADLMQILRGRPLPKSNVAQPSPGSATTSQKAVHTLSTPDSTKCVAPSKEITFSPITVEGVTFDYPDKVATKVSKAGNGAIYQLASADQCLQINIHHYFNTMGTDAAGLLQKELEARSSNTYKFKKGNTFALAGAESGWGYYKRGLMYGDKGYYVTDIEIVVPESLIKQYSDLIGKISLSAKVTGNPAEKEYVDSGVEWHATRNTSRDFYRIYIKSKEGKLEADYLSDALPANCQLGIKEDMTSKGADYSYCVQSYRDDVEAREKARWGL